MIEREIGLALASGAERSALRAAAYVSSSSAPQGVLQAIMQFVPARDRKRVMREVARAHNDVAAQRRRVWSAVMNDNMEES